MPSLMGADGTIYTEGPFIGFAREYQSLTALR